MIKKLLPILLILSIFLCASVPAQTVDGNLQVNNMEIEIWPEYDRSSALVIYRISFESLTSFPAKVSFKIPTSAGEPYSVAMKDLDGLLYDLEFSVIPDGSWNRIEFITSTPDIQLEFYDPITVDQNDYHNYSFRWISDYAVKDLKLVVQQPRYAPFIFITPNIGNGSINHDDGLIYYTSDLGSNSQGSLIEVSLRYKKTQDAFSVSTLPVDAVNPLPANRSFWSRLSILASAVFENRPLMVAGSLTVFGAVLLLVVSLLVLQKRNLIVPSESDPKENPQKKRTVNTSEVLEVYCHVCGKRARPGDQYCRTCGSKLILR